MPFTIRPYHRLPPYNAPSRTTLGRYSSLPLASYLGFGSISIPCLGGWQITGQKGTIASPR